MGASQHEAALMPLAKSGGLRVERPPSAELRSSTSPFGGSEERAVPLQPEMIPLSTGSTRAGSRRSLDADLDHTNSGIADTNLVAGLERELAHERTGHDDVAGTNPAAVAFEAFRKPDHRIQ